MAKLYHYTFYSSMARPLESRNGNGSTPWLCMAASRLAHEKFAARRGRLQQELDDEQIADALCE